MVDDVEEVEDVENFLPEETEICESDVEELVDEFGVLEDEDD